MVECIKDFIQADYRLVKGETYSGPLSVEDWMLSSFPAHFVKAEAGAVVADVPRELVDHVDADEPVDVEAKDIEEPPADKMLRRAAKRK